jgi:hypothetical protein
MQSAPELLPNDLTMTPVVSLPELHIRPSTSRPLGNHVSGATALIQEEQAQTSSIVGEMVDMEDAVTRIGSVLDDGRFMCDDEKCAGLTFGRQAELRRHYTTLHAINKPEFWCHVSLCPRSKSVGGEAFHRKDKLMAHVRTMHHNVP